MKSKELTAIAGSSLKRTGNTFTFKCSHPALERDNSANNGFKATSNAQQQTTKNQLASSPQHQPQQQQHQQAQQQATAQKQLQPPSEPTQAASAAAAGCLLANGSAGWLKAPASATTDAAYVCSGCNKPIKRDKFLLKACDKYWHENCLRCDRCQSRLGELGSTLYCKSNMNLCRQDYLELFGESGVCSACEKIIRASEMVMRARENVYHIECFACQLCGQRFCLGDRFYLWENKVVCQYDYEEHILPIQSSLQLEQQQQQQEHQHQHQHNSHLCAASSSLSAFQSSLSQLADYSKSCMLTMNSYLNKPQELVGAPETSDLKKTLAGSLQQQQPAKFAGKPHQFSQLPAQQLEAAQTRESLSMLDEKELRKKLVDLSDLKSKKAGNKAALKSSEPDKSEPERPNSGSATSARSKTSNQPASTTSTGRIDGRRGPKRPRTILTTSQRRAFKNSFDLSQKPCRKVREALAKETGLSVRIVQVWFQNQRAKLKKLQRKQMPQVPQSAGVSMAGNSALSGNPQPPHQSGANSLSSSSCSPLHHHHAHHSQQQQQQQQQPSQLLGSPKAHLFHASLNPTHQAHPHHQLHAHHALLGAEFPLATSQLEQQAAPNLHHNHHQHQHQHHNHHHHQQHQQQQRQHQLQQQAQQVCSSQQARAQLSNNSAGGAQQQQQQQLDSEQLQSGAQNNNNNNNFSSNKPGALQRARAAHMAASGRVARQQQQRPPPASEGSLSRSLSELDEEEAGELLEEEDEEEDYDEEDEIDEDDEVEEDDDDDEDDDDELDDDDVDRRRQQQQQQPPTRAPQPLDADPRPAGCDEMGVASGKHIMSEQGAEPSLKQETAGDAFKALCAADGRAH